MLPLLHMFFTQYLVVIVIVIIICFQYYSNICSCTLTILPKIQAVQDVILPLMNLALTSDLLSEPIFLDYLELHLDFLLLNFVTKPTAYR